MRVGAASGTAATIAALVLAAGAVGHRERPTTFPDPSRGSVPAVRTGGPSIVVCKPDSEARIRRLPPPARSRALALLPRCTEEHIQAAVDAAANGTRILLLPGVYREEPSRRIPYPVPLCEPYEVPPADGPGTVPGYRYTLRCPNAQNLIAVVGDSDDDGVCDSKCNLQIEGMGARPADVLIDGDRTKLNVIRADRADGIVLRNFTVQYSDFNNVYVLETNGFRFDRVVSRWSREYGFLTFSVDHGLYENLVAYGNGDAAFYPGSSAEGGCRRYSVEIRDSEAYGNVLGVSGTGANSIWVHDSSFHGNTAGIVVDSVSPGHPGMPQDCARFERNRVYANNLDPYTAERDAYCARPALERNPRVLCPSFPMAVGTGILILGGNRNVIRANRIYDNWRWGTALYWVPGFSRGDESPEAQLDTSHGNRYVGNVMGLRPDGRRAANGRDFFWDGQGSRNCWERNGRVSSVPARLDTCPGRAEAGPARPEAFAELVACIAWNPQTNPNPAGCSWLRRPPKPR